MPSCLGGEENGINLVAFDDAVMRHEMQPWLTASCRFDPYPNSNNGGCSEVIRDTAVTDTKNRFYEDYIRVHCFYDVLLFAADTEYARGNSKKVHDCTGGRGVINQTGF